jgi:hypothetical protein
LCGANRLELVSLDSSRSLDVVLVVSQVPRLVVSVEIEMELSAKQREKGGVATGRD